MLKSIDNCVNEDRTRNAQRKWGLWIPATYDKEGVSINMFHGRTKKLSNSSKAAKSRQREECCSIWRLLKGEQEDWEEHGLYWERFATSTNVRIGFVMP